jgi:hypothetical protein
MRGYGRRLGRSHLSRQLSWNLSWYWCNTKQGKGSGQGCCKQTRRDGLGRCGASKTDLADPWSNSDFEFSQKVNAHYGTCHSSLQEAGSKKLTLKQQFFE